MADGNTSPDLETAVARARRLLALLSELSGMGMDLVRVLHRQVMDGASAADAALKYCRLAKAIRRLVALEMRLAEGLDDVAAGRWAADEAERELRTLADQARDDAALETVEEALRDTGDTEAVERLDDWHAERAVERDFADRSVAQIVTGACQAMGLDPDPALLADEAMKETLADAVRAYAAALSASPQAAASLDGSPGVFSTLTARSPNPAADPRPPPA